MSLFPNLPKRTEPGQFKPGFVPKPNTLQAREIDRANEKAEKAAIRKQAERAAGVSGDDGTVPPAMRETVLGRDKYTCQGCGACGGEIREDETVVKLHADHIKPWRHGGPTLPFNLITRCDRCNLAKGSRRDIEAEKLMLDKAKANTERVLAQARAHPKS